MPLSGDLEFSRKPLSGVSGHRLPGAPPPAGPTPAHLAFHTLREPGPGPTPLLTPNHLQSSRALSPAVGAGGLRQDPGPHTPLLRKEQTVVEQRPQWGQGRSKGAWSSVREQNVLGLPGEFARPPSDK